MTASFIIYFHLARINCLLQTIRLLEDREPDLVSRSELILICQNGQVPIQNNFTQTIQVDLKLDYYHKPKMNNLGVRLASAENLVLLDSDRVLPSGYFQRAIDDLNFGEAVTTACVLALERPYSDTEIQSGEVRFSRDTRSATNQMHRKNMFSGNTVMKRQDYLDVGGMDESFLGYGYADTDMTQNLLQRDFKMVYLEEPEYHLWHSHEDLARYRWENFQNGLKFCQKWSLPPSEALIKAAHRLGERIDDWHLRWLI